MADRLLAVGYGVFERSHPGPNYVELHSFPLPGRGAADNGKTNSKEKFMQDYIEEVLDAQDYDYEDDETLDEWIEV
ncbi:hypothetical protein ACXYTJ_06470 [Gilvimarinus sp. F26214L]|uniref:hypothetical protein n=1 Tax=Gilvimarinus sp. DZF01 TaxID=3461371 RepID=UPI00404645E0